MSGVNTHAATGILQATQGNNQQILDAINTIGLAYGYNLSDPSNTVLKNQNDLEGEINTLKIAHINGINDLKDSISSVITATSSNNNIAVTSLKDTINNTLNVSSNENKTLITTLTSTIENAITQSLTGVSNTFKESFDNLANNISNRDISANSRFENLISSLTQDANSSNDSLNRFAESIVNTDISANERIEKLITTLTIIDNSANIELHNLAQTIINKDSSANDRFEKLINTIHLTDISHNERFENLLSTINNNDISRNISFENLITQIKQNDISFNNNFNNLISTINANDVSTNNLISTLISRDASNSKALIDTLISIDTNASSRNSLLINRLSNFDVSLNTSLENILSQISISDSCSNYIFQNMTQQLINSDASANERIYKLCNSIHNFDISSNTSLIEAIQVIDNSRNEALKYIKNLDASTNENIINLIDKIDQGNNMVIDKMQEILTAINVSHDENIDNICDVMNSLNIKSNDTQQKLQEYIGRYIVIPLFKQRIIDTSVTYYKMLENRILCVIEDYLVYFRLGDIASLVVYFNTKKQIELASDVYDIKREAFEAFLKFTPGATCFSDMDDDTMEQYKSFRKYISWAYKTLDGLIKAIEMWNKLNTYESYGFDAEILNDKELLTDYLTACAEEERKKFAFLEEEEVGLNIGGDRLAIKPKYEEYRKRYGWPQDGIFDAEKMAGIIKDLEAQGIIEPPKEDICTTSGTSSNENTECTSNTETGETSNTETGETSNTEYGETSNTEANSSSSPETQESSSETIDPETSDCNDRSSSDKSTSDKSTSDKSTSDKSTSDKSTSDKSNDDSNNPSSSSMGNSDSEQCKSLSDTSNKSSNSSNTDINSVVKSFSTCSSDEGVANCSFSSDDLCNNELTQYTTAAYFVYVAIEDDFHAINTFYYPLFLSKNDAIDANDISSNNEVMSWTFVQHPGIIFWMPFSTRSNWGPNSISHPPLAMEYIHFTNCIGSSGIYYHPVSRNKQPRNSFNFEINNASVIKYLMESPVIIDEQLDPVGDFDTTIKIPWISLPDASQNNWKNLFCFSTDATIFNDIYANNKNLKFYSDKNQWYNGNLLTLDIIDPNYHNLKSYLGKTSISTDYINHISMDLFNNTFMWQVFTNLDDILNDLSNNNIESDIKTKIEISDACGATGLQDVSVLPSTILSQLAHNSQFGHDRIKNLLAERNGDVSKKMCLLQEGDYIQFNITIIPSNNGIVENIDNRRVTKKTYNICFVLLHSDPKNYDLDNLQLTTIEIFGRFFPSNELKLQSPMFDEPNPPGTFTYQWMSNGVDIDGANDINYILTDADASSNISSRITFTHVNDTSNSIITDDYYINNTQIPIITGSLFEGFTLFARSYFIRGDLSYQWNRNGVPIDGATLECYLLTEQDISSNISVTVTTDFPFIAPVTSEATTIIKNHEDPVEPTNFKGLFSHTNKVVFKWDKITNYPFDYYIERIYTVTVGDNSYTSGISQNHISKEVFQNVSLPVSTNLDTDIDILQIIVDKTNNFSSNSAEDEKNTYVFPLNKDTWSNSLIRYVVFIQDSSSVKMMELVIEKIVVMTTTKLILGDLKCITNPSSELLNLCPLGEALNFDNVNRFSFTEWSADSLILLHNEWNSATLTNSQDYALQNVTLNIYEEIAHTNENNFPYEITDYQYKYVIRSENNNNVISNRSSEIIFVSDSEKILIDTWLSNNSDTLNRFGDPIDTVYTGGNPLFNESDEIINDLYDYIKTQNPTNPWIIN
jgi:hypothetical protein